MKILGYILTSIGLLLLILSPGFNIYKDDVISKGILITVIGVIFIIIGKFYDISVKKSEDIKAIRDKVDGGGWPNEK